MTVTLDRWPELLDRQTSSQRSSDLLPSSFGRVYVDFARGVQVMAHAKEPNFKNFTPYIGEATEGASRMVLDQLQSIEDGWLGEGSIRPSPSVISDVELAFAALDEICAPPEVEVGEDGNVALLWETEDQTFALTFPGNGKVIGTLSPQTLGYHPWALSVEEGEALTEKLSVPPVAPLIS